MPKGIPNHITPKPAEETPRKLTLTLRPEHYDALIELASEQYRTVELQAAWLLVKVLSEAGRTPPHFHSTGYRRALHPRRPHHGTRQQPRH